MVNQSGANRLTANKTTNKERTKRMTNMLNQSTGRPRLTKTTFLSILAITGVVITAAFFRADAGANQPVQTTVAGTWMSIVSETADLASFMSDGRMIYTIPVIINTGSGPITVALVGSAHGEWIQTGAHEFVYTAFALNSNLAVPQPVAFSRFVKLNATLKLNDTTGELTQNLTISVFSPDGTLEGTIQGGTRVFKRIVAGQ